MIFWLTHWRWLLRVWLYGLGVSLLVGALAGTVVLVTRIFPEVVIAWVLLLIVFGICIPLLFGLILDGLQHHG
jgi:hypothetical protein